MSVRERLISCSSEDIELRLITQAGKITIVLASCCEMRALPSSRLLPR
jgi:hypothetical protein